MVDASALVDVLVGEGRALGRLAVEELCAPHLLDAEVGSVLRGKLLAGELELDVCSDALGDLQDLEVLRWPHVGLLERALELRSNVTFYDGLYVALAEHLDVPLVTLDGRLAKSPGVRAAIELLP